MTRRPGWAILLVGAWLFLLLVSHVVRRLPAAPLPPRPGVSQAEVTEVDGHVVGTREIRLVYTDRGPATPGDAPVVLLLHGSPGSRDDFSGIVPPLAVGNRVIAPDLPGFGDSERSLPDYSARAGAAYLGQLLDRLDLRRVHVVGFSLGGVVALELAGLESRRVASITLLSATGVQELELLGDYRLNRMVHGAQLAALWLLYETVPHMGLLDGSYVDVPYARSFYDTDQRAVRDLLAAWDGPMLIIHGREDVLVPVEAASEHHRIVPQSELELHDANHFLVFRRPEEIAGSVAGFVSRVEEGATKRRSDLPTEVRDASLRPFDPDAVPPVGGLTLALVAFLIIVATLVSEDAACIGVGLMVAHGRIEFLPGIVACLVGIVIGDAGLFLAGRYLGQPFLHRAPLRWFLRPERVERSREWFRSKGLVVILASRFFPGARLPTYFAAGMVGVRLRVFFLYFLFASVLWTPLLVGASAAVGRTTIEWFEDYRRFTLPGLLVVGVAVLLAVRVVLPMLTYAGRRRLVGWWTRLTRWEFWPPWAFYPPVVLHVARLGLSAGHRTAFTAANPAIEAGGFVGESKHAILRGLAGSPEFVARSAFIAGTLPPEQRVAEMRRFVDLGGGGFPVVLKPDVGQRGAGVAIVRSEGEGEAYLGAVRGDVIAQEYVSGDEFGIFYHRHPDAGSGKIFSITEKRVPVVVGDGKTPLSRLILQDPRHVAMARVYFADNADRLDHVPAEGESVRLAELGTHCRGAIFLDGGRLLTSDLEEVIDRISGGFDGFFFGRYDVRTPSVDDLQRGRNFKVIELNGVTSEATHIYDPKTGLRDAYRVLFEQWRIAYEIGEANVARGYPVASLRELARLVVDFRRRSRLA